MEQSSARLSGELFYGTSTALAAGSRFPSFRPPGERQRSFSLSDFLLSSEVALHLRPVAYICYPGMLVFELLLHLAFIPGISGNSPDLLHDLCISENKLTDAFPCCSPNLRAHTVWRLWLVEAWAAEWSFLMLFGA